MNTADTISQDFEALYTDSRTGFVMLANSYTEDRAIAEDIATDAFVSCWLRRDEITDDLERRKYICGAVKKKCLEYLRNKQTQLRIQRRIFDENYRMLHYQIESLENGNPEKMLESEVLEIYRQQLSEMPELTRSIFLASRDDSLSYKEIADKYGIPARKVTYEIQRALSLLRTSLRDYLPLIAVAIGAALRRQGL